MTNIENGCSDAHVHDDYEDIFRQSFDDLLLGDYDDDDCDDDPKLFVGN